MGRYIVAVLATVLIWGVPTASAGTVGHWTRVTDPTGRNIDEVSVARTADGVLHVAYTRPTPGHASSAQDLLERSISIKGTAGPPVILASDWALFGNPAIVATGPNALDVFDGGTRTTDPTETLRNLEMFSSPDGGASWVPPASDLTTTGGAAGSIGLAAALGTGGVPFAAWGSSACLCVLRVGVPPTPNYDFQQGLGDFGYDPGMAVDTASGQADVAWYSNGTGHKGVYAATIDQSSGARAGSPVHMPGTSNLLDGPFNGRTPIVGRPGGGLYVAYEGGYPSHSKVLLWRVGASQSKLIAQRSSGVRSVGVASTPSGRVWVFWSAQTASGKQVVYGKRSNPSATAFGQTVSVSSPHGATSSWNLVGDGQTGRLDLLGSFSLHNSDTNIATWHTQVLPGLSFSATPTVLPVHAKHAKAVTFVVTDAGAPVSGVHVHVGKVSGTTNGQGKVTLKLGPFAHKAHLHAHASLHGYVEATLVLKVK
jgi:hypothetical protein